MAFLPGLVLSPIFKHACSTEEEEPRQAIDTLANCSLVCKQWQYLIACDEVEDDRLWKAIAFRLSPAFPTNLSHLLFWEGVRPSWRSACKLHLGWSRAFIAPLPQSRLHPSVSDHLCDLDLPPVPRSCYRIFSLAATALTSRTPFLIEPRRSADLPQLEDALITFDYDCNHFTVLTSYGTILRAECATIFPGMDDRCHVSGHCSRAMHLRKVCRSELPMIFEASKNGLMYYNEEEEEDDDDNDDDDDDDADDDDDDNVVEEDKNDNDYVNCERRKNAVCGAPDDLDNSTTYNGNDVKAHNIDDSEQVFVVHNVLADLTCDLWVVCDEPFLYAYWKDLLVYCPWSSPGYSSNIIKCVESGITGIQHWCVEVDIAPNRLEINSKYVVALGSAYELENFRLKLILMSMETGQVLHFFDTKLSIIDKMLLTDTCLVLSLDKTPTTVYRLPDLEPLFVLPLPDCNSPTSSLDLSPCGRYLGLSTVIGELVIYDMSKGSIKYYGSNGLGPPKNYKREVGDGVWLWYKDVELQNHTEVSEKILYWQLRQPDSDYYEFLSTL